MSEKNKDENPFRISMVGPSQAGKTVLAVGLYAATSAEYSVEIEETTARGEFNAYMTAMESGKWPDPTNGSKTAVTFKINRGKKTPVVVNFADYMGESMRKFDEIKKIIGDPQGVMILMNPQMKTRDDQGRVVDMGADKRVELQEQVKSVINYLSAEGSSCKHVAVVVTAADLLGTDLQNKEFDEYKRKIINCLEANPKFCGKWKEFNVSVTGALEDPTHPRIASGDGDMSPRKPFEWLIEQIEQDAQAQSTKSTWRKCFYGFLSVLGLGLLASLLHYCWIDRMKEGEIVDAIDKHEVVKYLKDLDELEKHVTELRSAVRKAPESATQDICFVKNQKRYLNRRKELVELKDEAVLSWTKQKIKEEERNVSKKPAEEADFAWLERTIESIDEFDVDLADVETSSLSNRLAGVKEEFKAARARMLKKIGSYFCENLKDQIDQEEKDVNDSLKAGGTLIAVEPHRKFWRNVFENYDCGSSNVLGVTKRAWKDIVDKKAVPVCSNLCVKIDKHNANVIVADVAQAKASMASDIANCDPKKVNKVLVDIKNYEPLAQANAYSRLHFAPQTEVGNLKVEKESLLVELRSCLVAGVKKRHAKTLSPEENGFVAGALQKAQVIPPAEYNDWYGKLRIEMGLVDKEWVEKQRMEGEKLVADLTSYESATEALGKFENLCSEYPLVATMTNVVDAVNEIVRKECNGIYEKTKAYLDCKIDLRDSKQMERRRKDMNETFSSLRSLVDAVEPVKDFVKGTEMGEFVNACLSRGKLDKKNVVEVFKQDYEVTRIEVKVDDEQRVEFEMATVTFEEIGEYVRSHSRGACNTYENADKGKWKTIWPKDENDGPARVSGSPWKDAILYLKATKTNRRNKTEEVRWLLQKGEKMDYSGEDCHGKYLERSFALGGFNVCVRIYVQAEGKDFFSEVGHTLGMTPAAPIGPLSSKDGQKDDGVLLPGLDVLGVPLDGVNLPR